MRNPGTAFGTPDPISWREFVRDSSKVLLGNQQSWNELMPLLLWVLDAPASVPAMAQGMENGMENK